jgi:putative endonuclease
MPVIAKAMTKKPENAILRRLRERKGRRAENAAALWLQLKGYRILDRRARTPACEIDLIAVKKNMLVFIEVKSRRTQDAALESVTPQLRRRLEQAARIWVTSRHKLQNHLWRFDIVLLSPGRFPRHMRDAWRAEN